MARPHHPVGSRFAGPGERASGVAGDQESFVPGLVGADRWPPDRGDAPVSALRVGEIRLAIARAGISSK